MKTRVPVSLEKTGDASLVVDAVYYVVRVLRNSIRGYVNAAVSAEPSLQARRLAERAIKEIEEAEQQKIEKLPDDRLQQYITTLEAFLTSRSVAKGGTRDAERILKKMRAEY